MTENPTNSPHIHRSPHDWASPEYVKRWQQRADRELGARRYRFELLADLLPFDADTPIRILDMGAGFGALSEVILERYPNAQLVCLDGSAAMLDLLKHRQVNFGNRIQRVFANFKNPDWHERLSGLNTDNVQKFDAVISSLAMHGLRDQRAELFKQIYDIVKVGGCFINIDLTLASTERLQKYYREVNIARHIEHVKSVSDQTLTYEQAEMDIDTPTVKQNDVSHEATQDNNQRKWQAGDLNLDLKWLREAGFEDVDCFWKELKSAMIGGFKN